MSEDKPGEYAGEQLQKRVSPPSEMGKVAIEALSANSRDVKTRSSSEARDFEGFYKEAYGELFSYANKKFGSVHTAEDITAETMTAVLRNWPLIKTWLEEPKGKKRLMRYAMGILKNEIYDAYVRSPQQKEVIMPPPEDIPSKIDGPEAYISEWDIDSAIGKLPPPQQQVIKLTQLGVSSDEIAEAIDLNPSSVRTRLSRARSSLRAALEEEQ